MRDDRALLLDMIGAAESAIFDVRLDVVWVVARQRLPELIALLRPLLPSE
jgi:hypothetical protein